MNKEELEERLIIGAKIKIGKKYAENFPQFKEDQIIELVEGVFEYDNGLYIDYQDAPSWWDEDEEDFESIYHLFGNDLERFMDCEILSTQ